jgi:Na+/serine symporter
LRLALAIPLLLFVLIGIASAFYRKENQGLARWRRILFLLGILANAVSAAVLFTFSTHAFIAAHGTKPVDIDRMYPVLSMMIVGLLAAVLGCSGRRVSRVLLVGDGLLTTIFWYLAALATSP